VGTPGPAGGSAARDAGPATVSALETRKRLLGRAWSSLRASGRVPARRPGEVAPG
jgi:hypothetical protein